MKALKNGQTPESFAEKLGGGVDIRFSSSLGKFKEIWIPHPERRVRKLVVSEVSNRTFVVGMHDLGKIDNDVLDLIEEVDENTVCEEARFILDLSPIDIEMHESAPEIVFRFWNETGDSFDCELFEDVDGGEMYLFYGHKFSRKEVENAKWVPILENMAPMSNWFWDVRLRPGTINRVNGILFPGNPSTREARLPVIRGLDLNF